MTGVQTCALPIYDVGVQSLALRALKVDEAAHGGQQPLGDGEPQPQSSGKAAAAGIRLVKDVIHLGELGIRHADARIPDVDDKVDAIL